jgi:hypothetical protein
MSNKWRIKKIVSWYGESYILQKRLFGFLWWYNPDNIDGAITGVYDTLAGAELAHKLKTTPAKVEYLEI